MPDLRPPLPQLVEKIAARARARGAREVISTGVERLREELASLDELTFYTSEASESADERDDLVFREANARDAGRYAADIGTDAARTFGSRLQSDVRCFVVIGDGRMLHASWVTTTAAWTREVRGYFTPPLGDAYIYESYTHADARGRGIYPFALRGIRAATGAEGLRRLWVGVLRDNPASVRAVEKAGFEPGFTLVYRRRLGRLRVLAVDGPLAHVASEVFRDISLSGAGGGSAPHRSKP